MESVGGSSAVMRASAAAREGGEGGRSMSGLRISVEGSSGGGGEN